MRWVALLVGTRLTLSGVGGNRSVEGIAVLFPPGEGGPESRIDDVIRPVMVLLLVSLARVVLVNLAGGSLIAGAALLGRTRRA